MVEQLIKRAQNELGTFTRIGQQTASDLLATVIRLQEQLSEVREVKNGYYEAMAMWRDRAEKAEAITASPGELWALCYLHDWDPPKEGQIHRWEPGKNISPLSTRFTERGRKRKPLGEICGAPRSTGCFVLDQKVKLV